MIYETHMVTLLIVRLCYEWIKVKVDDLLKYYVTDSLTTVSLYNRIAENQVCTHKKNHFGSGFTTECDISRMNWKTGTKQHCFTETIEFIPIQI